MNAKRAFAGFVAVFIAAILLGTLVHGVLLDADYKSVSQLNRLPAEQQARLSFLLLAYFCYAAAFVWIYAKGVEAKPWLGQGIRFGILVWLLSSVPAYLIRYMAEPWPGSLVAKQIGFDFVSVTLLGVIVAAIYRKAPAQA